MLIRLVLALFVMILWACGNDSEVVSTSPSHSHCTENYYRCVEEKKKLHSCRFLDTTCCVDCIKCLTHLDALWRLDSTCQRTAEHLIDSALIDFGEAYMRSRAAKIKNIVIPMLIQKSIFERTEIRLYAKRPALKKGNNLMTIGTYDANFQLLRKEKPMSTYINFRLLDLTKSKDSTAPIIDTINQYFSMYPREGSQKIDVNIVLFRGDCTKQKCIPEDTLSFVYGGEGEKLVLHFTDDTMLQNTIHINPLGFDTSNPIRTHQYWEFLAATITDEKYCSLPDEFWHNLTYIDQLHILEPTEYAMFSSLRTDLTLKSIIWEYNWQGMGVSDCFGFVWFMANDFKTSGLYKFTQEIESGRLNLQCYCHLFRNDKSKNWLPKKRKIKWVGDTLKVE